MHATRRRLGTPAWLGLGLVVALPSLAEAQLFPNRTITRQRQDCATEPPFYSTVRKNYFGYYPTCWSRFPAGWQCPCPNPELPNVPGSFAAQPRDKLVPLPADPSLEGDAMGDDAAPPLGGAPAGDAGIPPVPNSGRSPFNAELNPPGDAGAGTRTPADPGLAPDPGRAPLPGGRTRPANPGLPEASPSTSSLLEMPKINLPGPTPASAAAASPADATPAAEPATNVGGLVLAPEATLTSTEAGNRPASAPVPAGAMPAGPEVVVESPLPPGPPVAGTPAQAPQRRGILSGLIGGKRRR